MTKYTEEDVLKLASENEVKFINLQFSDIFGVSKNISITVENLDRALDGKCMFDGSSIDGFVRIEESDMYLHPDPGSFLIFPWNSNNGKTARLVCDVVKHNGDVFEGDPRYILKKVLKKFNNLGYDCVNVGPECEFFLFKTDEKGEPKTITQDKGGYFDLSPVDLGENARRDMCHILEKMGFEIEAAHHESAPGQHEIDFKYTDGLAIADCIQTFKQVVKTVAYRNGLYATFIPKPITGVSGSGMHTNLSIFKNGKNIFHSDCDSQQLSPEAYWFIGGLIKYSRDISAITNPLVNSYKRLVPGHEAPMYVAWSAMNRSTMIRIPPTRGDSTRIELRSPDPACNPYLALALILNAGLEGIVNKIDPPEPCERNLYSLSDTQITELGLEKLPESLIEAINCMKNSKMVREVLEEHIFEKYIEAKTYEWYDYKKVVTQWEFDQYLGKY
ncbi:MAG: type I glutamate--ammonia ligase [Bacillota bacterium]|nr:type I glutamate--ammonia ligase [Bacillota bacterium]